MRKMYFAMIPKRSLLEDVALVAAIGTGVVVGAKYLLGKEKFDEYAGVVKARINGATAVKGPDAQGPDTGIGIEDDDLKAKEEESILDRIRRAASR